MTWEQKCRISALRAACASQFTIYGTPAHLTAAPPDGESDEAMTTRILQRAETFRNALLADGALDYTLDDDEPSETIEGTVANCTRCLRAVTWFQPPEFQGRWIDANGISTCRNAGVISPHTVEPIPHEAVRELCPGCGSNNRLIRQLVTSFSDAPHDERGKCTHVWHQL